MRMTPESFIEHCFTLARGRKFDELRRVYETNGQQVYQELTGEQRDIAASLCLALPNDAPDDVDEWLDVAEVFWAYSRMARSAVTPDERIAAYQVLETLADDDAHLTDQQEAALESALRTRATWYTD